jgi:hypothetical protein
LVFDLEYESTNRAEYVALDYAAEKRDRSRFQRHLAAVEAQGYRPVAYGDGLALLVRSDVPPARRGCSPGRAHHRAAACGNPAGSTKIIASAGYEGG